MEYSFMAGSHTHNGPVLELSDAPGKGQGKFDASIRYYKQMEDGIVAAIVEADKKLVPARCATASTQLDGWNVNRHTKIAPKPVERELAIMRFDDAATGKPIAIVVNWTGHPTTIPSSVLKFSADYVGALKNEVTARTGAATIFMQGASGDQSVVKDKGTQGYGTAMGDEVVKLAAGLKTEDVAAPTLVVKEDRFAFKSRVDFGNPMVSAAYSKAFFPELIPNFIDEYAESVRPASRLHC